MPSPVRFAIVAILGMLVLPSALRAQDAPEADRRPGVGVMRFDNGGSHGPDAEPGDFEALEVGLQQMLITELGQNTELRLVERGRIAELTREMDLLEDDRLVDPSTAMEIGRLVQARYMVMGSFADVFGEVRMDARIVNVETGEWVTGSKVQGRSSEILSLVVDLADQLTRAVELPPLPEVEREEREEEARSVPRQAFTEYSLALKLIDEGFTAEGVQQLERVVERFPEWEEPRQALDRQRSDG